jgi:hypothetical protein
VKVLAMGVEGRHAPASSRTLRGTRLEPYPDAQSGRDLAELPGASTLAFHVVK